MIKLIWSTLLFIFPLILIGWCFGLDFLHSFIFSLCVTFLLFMNNTIMYNVLKDNRKDETYEE